MSSGTPLPEPSPNMKFVHSDKRDKRRDPDGGVCAVGCEVSSSKGTHPAEREVGGDSPSTQEPSSLQKIKPRDDQFYLRSAIFEVEDVLFQLPIANFIQESEVFKTLFAVPQPVSPTSTRGDGEDPIGDEDDLEGATDTNPIRLEGVKKDDFKSLVRVMYARAYADEEVLSEAQWTSVLVLSKRRDMSRLQALAIAKLTPALGRDPHKMAVMGRTYDISSWLISGIHALVVRTDLPMGYWTHRA